MRDKIGRKVLMTFGLICLLLILVPSAAFSWGDAVHVYISDRLKSQWGYSNINEMWGSLGPDIFNYIFDPALCPAWLADQTHGTTSDSFMKVWSKADTISEKALAYGFVSHNEAWGADFTAHVSGLRFGQDYGYINEKAMVLLNTPINPAEPHSIQNPTFGEIFTGIGLEYEQQVMVAHVIAEYAIDITLRNDVDPFIGLKVAGAALARSEKFPALLVDAYAADYAANCPGIDYPTAAYIIASAEAEYRNGMISYGKAISKPEPAAVQLIAQQIVALAPGFLGGPLPIPEADAIELVKAGIYVSMEICGDYMTEINATIRFVRRNLTHNRITY